MSAVSCMDISLQLLLLKLVGAFLAGIVIGIEREKHGRPAGLRTHILVCTGACLMMIVSEGMFVKYHQLTSDSIMRVDPGRIAAQIITGIGFLGAGVIIKEGSNIRGLTTAACLWYAAGVGMAFGAGLFSAAITATILAMTVLLLMKRLEPIFKKDCFLNLCVVTDSATDLFPQLEKILNQMDVRISNIEQNLDLHENIRRYDLVITQQTRRIGRDLVAAITALPGVLRVRYR